MNQPARKLRGCADLELSKMQAVAAEREANTPTPSPAPQWAKNAMTEIRSLCHEEVYSESGQCEAIITKHAAAISEENERLKQEVEEALKIANDEEAVSAPKGGDLGVLSEREKTAFQNGYWSAAHNIAHDIGALLAAHPAATNLTEEGK